MRLRASSSLGHDNTVGRQHTIRLRGSFTASSLFQSLDPALELGYRADEIRCEFVELFLQTHMPVLLANCGHVADPSGDVDSEIDMDAGSQWLITDESDGPALANRFDLQANVRTSCDTDPVQAASLVRANIAELLAEQVMGALAKQYLGLNHTSSSTTMDTSDGILTDYHVEEGTSR